MRAPRPTATELSDESRYRLIEIIAHDELAAASRRHLRVPGAFKTAYLAINVFTFAVLGVSWILSQRPFLENFPTLCVGMCLGYLILMPIHEHIHATVYRWFGSRDTRVIYTFRTLSAYCVADRFVATGREFIVIALAPFVVLNTLLGIMIAVVGGFPIVLWGMFLVHVGGSSGDFAFANLVWRLRDQGLMTYDDVEGGRSYFYRTLSNEPRPAQTTPEANAI